MVNLHDTLVNIASSVPDGNVAALVSKGIDSQAVALALLEAGKTVHVYSFALKGNKSSDMVGGMEFAKRHGLTFTPIWLPSDTASIERAVVELVSKYKARSKTEIECSFPMLFAYPRILERVVASGVASDGHFCLTKSGILHSRGDVDGFRRKYFANPNAGQRVTRGLIASACGKKLLDPYYDKRIAGLLDGLTWEQLNKPRQKMPIRAAFPGELYAGPMQSNLQLGDSGIARAFEQLHEVYPGHKSVVGIYNEIARRYASR